MLGRAEAAGRCWASTDRAGRRPSPRGRVRSASARAAWRHRPSRTRRRAGAAGSRPRTPGRGTSRPSNSLVNSATRASSSSRLASGWLCRDAHAPTWLPRGRDAKYASDSSRARPHHSALDPHLLLQPVPVEAQCRVRVHDEFLRLARRVVRVEQQTRPRRRSGPGRRARKACLPRPRSRASRRGDRPVEAARAVRRVPRPHETCRRASVVWSSVNTRSGTPLVVIDGASILRFPAPHPVWKVPAWDRRSPYARWRGAREGTAPRVGDLWLSVSADADRVSGPARDAA